MIKGGKHLESSERERDTLSIGKRNEMTEFLMRSHRKGNDMTSFMLRKKTVSVQKIKEEAHFLRQEKI